MNMMNTKIERVNPEQIDETIMEEAGRLIAEGELVAFPTETVYGLGGDALHPEAARKIYAAKGRPSDNPLIVHIADFSDMERVAREVPEAARKLAGAFWPGPLTMIVWKSDAVPHVAEDLSGRIAMILDGGPVGIGIESTIIDLTESKPMVLRPGYITPQMLSEVLGEEVIIDPGIIAADDTRKPKAPGMKYKHYAPKADMVIVDGPSDAVVSKINALVHQKQENGQKVAVIATEESGPSYHADVILSMGSRLDEDAIAQHLYRILRECDELHVDAIYSESFQTPRIGQAIMNRLLKAAGHTVIHCD